MPDYKLYTLDASALKVLLARYGVDEASALGSNALRAAALVRKEEMRIFIGLVWRLLDYRRHQSRTMNLDISDGKFTLASPEARREFRACFSAMFFSF
jgi:hypothetical protein